MTKAKMKKVSRKAYDLMAAIPRDEDGNTLTLEDTIRAVILKNPDMTRYRDGALNLLYCILGSGIDWINGRLEDGQPNNYINMPPAAGGQGCWSYEFGFEDSIQQMLGENPPLKWKKVVQKVAREQQQRHDREMEEVVATIEAIDSRCQEYGPKPRSWYPISWYACHLCAPANAQLDFLDGAIETATLICSTRLQPGTEKWIGHQQTKRYASEILEILLVQREARSSEEVKTGELVA